MWFKHLFYWPVKDHHNPWTKIWSKFDPEIMCCFSSWYYRFLGSNWLQILVNVTIFYLHWGWGWGGVNTRCEGHKLKMNIVYIEMMNISELHIILQLFKDSQSNITFINISGMKWEGVPMKVKQVSRAHLVIWADKCHKGAAINKGKAGVVESMEAKFDCKHFEGENFSASTLRGQNLSVQHPPYTKFECKHFEGAKFECAAPSVYTLCWYPFPCLL